MRRMGKRGVSIPPVSPAGSVGAKRLPQANSAPKTARTLPLNRSADDNIQKTDNYL